MKKHIITIGGIPGSGKSTISRMLAERLGYSIFSIGEFVREMAREQSLSLEEFNAHIAKDQSIDTLIDTKLTQLEVQGDRYIVDSHLAFHFIPSGFSVLLSTSLEKAAERIFNDAQSPTRVTSGETMKTLEETKEKTKHRIQNHLTRYEKYYNVIPYNTKDYLYVINTEQYTLVEIVDHILTAYDSWLQT